MMVDTIIITPDFLVTQVEITKCDVTRTCKMHADYELI